MFKGWLPHISAPIVAPASMMSVLLKCQLEKDGKCSSCSNIIADDSIIKCSKCKLLFHAVCSTYENEICNKTLFKLFCSKSTKSNFMWFCDACLTSFEFDAASNDTARINNLEHQINTMNSRFDEMKELILNTKPSSNKNVDNSYVQNNQNKENETNQKSNVTEKTKEPLAKHNINPWRVQTRVTILKDNLGNTPDLAEFEKRALDNNLKVKKATWDTKGNIVLVCPSAQDAVAVCEQATVEFPHNTVLEPRSPSSVINIVGFRTSHDLDTLYNLLISANSALSTLKGKPLEEVKMFFDIIAIKPCAKNPSVFRAVVRVSKTLRHLIRLSSNKLKIGFYVCSVYDRTIAKRCNKCQTFGHWANDCQPGNIVVCADCGQNHDTQKCKSESYHCINCAKITDADCNHSAKSLDCPAYIAYRNSEQNSLQKSPRDTGQNGSISFLEQAH